MKTKSLIVIAVLFSSLILHPSSFAQVPGLINYQGRIVDSGTNFTGIGQFEFALVGAGGTTNYWSNDGTPVGQPATAVSLTVSKGLFSVLLGDTTIPNMTASVAPSVFTNADVSLRVWLYNGVGFEQLSDQRLAAAGYALTAASVPNGAIGSNQIADASIVASKIVAGAVSALDIAPGAIGSNQIADASIVASKIVAGAVGALQIAPNAVSAADIAAGQVVKSLNGLTDSVSITAGANVTISTNGNSLAIAASGGGGSSTGDVLGARLNIGTNNILTGAYASIAGGYSNTASGVGAFVGGGGNDGFGVFPNVASGGGAVVGGGADNTANNFESTVAGGAFNTASGADSTVAGGRVNLASGDYSTVAGGANNTASSANSAVGGGQANTAQAPWATVAGGEQNTASGQYAAVGGGNVNGASGDYAAIPGGHNNSASGADSFAAGFRAKAMTDDTFVWGDGTVADFASTTNNQFLIRASNGVGIGTNNPVSALHVNGTVTATAFVGDGSGLTNLPAGQLPAGLVTNNQTGVTLSGSFTGNLTGNATSATTANNFSGSLAGDVTGPQGATVVGTVGGVSAANVASGANAANSATSADTASTIVKRDGSGNIIVGTVTGALNGNATTATSATTASSATTAGSATTANSFSGSLAGDVTGTQGATVIAAGAVTSSKIASGAVGPTQLAGTVVTNNATGVTLSGNFTAATGLVIENRTSDPSSPAIGQLWLRTDL